MAFAIGRISDQVRRFPAEFMIEFLREIIREFLCPVDEIGRSTDLDFSSELTFALCIRLSVSLLPRGCFSLLGWVNCEDTESNSQLRRIRMGHLSFLSNILFVL